LRWVLSWNSPEAARMFLADYARVVAGKWKNARITESAPVRLTGDGPRGGFLITVEGTAVCGVEGLKR
jgi:hypothetical protein